MIIATAVLSAYILDAYHKGSVGFNAWFTRGKVMVGFMGTYIEINWAIESGPLNALGAKTCITLTATLIILF